MKKHDAHVQKKTDEETVMGDVQTAPADHIQSEEWKSKYMRAIADYQNLERRSREEKEAVRSYANEMLLARLLPAIDTLSKAAAHLKDVGLDLAYKQFVTILDEKGVVRMNTVGEQFDPHTMECIDVVPGDENIVMEETQPGYTLLDKVLRVAQVKVGKKTVKSEDA